MTYGNGCRLNMALKNVARDRVSDPGDGNLQALCNRLQRLVLNGLDSRKQAMKAEKRLRYLVQASSECPSASLAFCVRGERSGLYDSSAMSPRH